MSVYTTEITSDRIPSDNPLHQRLLKAYLVAKPYIKGSLLELGCGEGRGIGELAPLAEKFTAIDKIDTVLEKLRLKYSAYRFDQGVFPPIPYPDNSFDTIISFQVIEHVKDDMLFLKEIHRILRPEGTALLSTPNIKMSLSRNPWHVREYTGDQLKNLALNYFDDVEMKGIAGDKDVLDYHEQNRASVQRIMKYDVLNLQYRLPAQLLRIPYDLLNRRNRNKLKKQDDQLVSKIDAGNYELREQAEDNLDLFCILKK